MVKLLVVDDDREVTDSIVKFLNMTGFEARSAYEGHEAIKLIKQDNPDCVLLDIQLPGTMSGVDVLDEIKSMDGDTKVVMITGFVEEETELMCRQHGVDGYIMKPLDLQNILDVVTGLTKGK